MAEGLRLLSCSEIRLWRISCWLDCSFSFTIISFNSSKSFPNFFAFFWHKWLNNCGIGGLDGKKSNLVD